MALKISLYIYNLFFSAQQQNHVHMQLVNNDVSSIDTESLLGNLSTDLPNHNENLQEIQNISELISNESSLMNVNGSTCGIQFSNGQENVMEEVVNQITLCQRQSFDGSIFSLVWNE